MPIQSCTQDSPGVFVGHSNGPLIPCSPQRAHFPPKSNHPQMGHPVRQHAHISSPFWLHLYGHSCINNHTLLCLKAVYKGSGLLWRASFVAVWSTMTVTCANSSFPTYICQVVMKRQNRCNFCLVCCSVSLFLDSHFGACGQLNQPGKRPSKAHAIGAVTCGHTICVVAMSGQGACIPLHVRRLVSLAI